MHKQILIVDDDATSLKYLTYVLKGHFTLDTAKSAEQALKRMRQSGPYAVVLTDFCMGDMDGEELLKRVRDLYPESVRILFTGTSRPEELAAELEEGLAFGFIEKPIKPLNLIHFIRAGLEHHQLLKSQKRKETLKSVLTTEELSFFTEKRDEPDLKELNASPEHGFSPGKRRFFETLSRMLAQAERSGSRVAVLSIVIGPCREDKRGKSPGGLILGKVSAKIKERLRDSDFILPTGPAEFSAALWDVDTPKDVENVCEDIAQMLRTPSNSAPALRADIGASYFPKDGRSPEYLLQKAVEDRKSPKAVAC